MKGLQSITSALTVAAGLFTATTAKPVQGTSDESLALVNCRFEDGRNNGQAVISRVAWYDKFWKRYNHEWPGALSQPQAGGPWMGPVTWENQDHRFMFDDGVAVTTKITDDEKSAKSLNRDGGLIHDWFCWRGSGYAFTYWDGLIGGSLSCDVIYSCSYVVWVEI